VFLRRVDAASTYLVSASARATALSGDCDGSALSADGRFVAFRTERQDVLASGTVGWSGIVVKDLASGRVTLASVPATHSPGYDDASAGPSISCDGRYVAFECGTDGLAAGDDNGKRDILLRDLEALETTLVSVSTAGLLANGSSWDAAISRDGSCVAFKSYASNLVPGDTNGRPDVFMRDVVRRLTTRVSVSSAEVPADDVSWGPAISADGRYVAFSSKATNLVPGDSNACSDVFVRDTVLGTTERVSVSSSGAQADNLSRDAAISADGRFVCFMSYATNLSTVDADSASDVFVRDRVRGRTWLVSKSLSGRAANDSSEKPTLSDSGLRVAFESEASNLVQGDTNGVSDVFVRDLSIGLGLTLSSSPAPPRYNTRFSLYSKLTDAYGRVRPNRTVTFEKRVGTRWVKVGTDRTNSYGRASVTTTGNVTAARYRARVSELFPYLPASRSATIAPAAVLTTPEAPDTFRVGRASRVECDMLPQHASGNTRALLFDCYRLEDSRWVLRKSVWATARDEDSHSECSAALTLPTRGWWRIKAHHGADSRIADSTSRYGLNVYVR